MKIETMLMAHSDSAPATDYVFRGRTGMEWLDLHARIRRGIILRYNALQAENAKLRKTIEGMDGDLRFMLDELAEKKAERDAAEYLLSECVNGAEPVNAELQTLRDENASLRDEVAFWKAEALKDGGDD